MVDKDAFEAEWSGAAARVTALAVLAWPEQPEVGDNDDVNDVEVGFPVDGVLGVEALEDGLNEEEVGRVGSGCGVVFVAEGFDKSIE